MAKMPPKHRRGAKKSLQAMCRRLGLPFKNSKYRANAKKKGQSDG